MRTMSIRSMAALAYERGEEYDPALAITPALMEQLSLSEHASRPVEAPSPYERQRRRRRERRQEAGRVPDWFAAGDLVERPPGVHGEIV